MKSFRQYLEESNENDVMAVVSKAGDIALFNAVSKYTKKRFASGSKIFRGSEGHEKFINIMKKNGASDEDIMNAVKKEI